MKLETIDIIAQVIGILAMAMNILSYQQKKQSGVIAVQMVGASLFAIHFWMLGAMVGALLNVVAAVRALIFYYKKQLHADHIAWTVGFEVVYFVCYALTFTVFGKAPTLPNLILEFLPVIGMTALMLGYRAKSAGAIRRFGLISSPAWLIYNVVNLSIGAICCETVSILSIVIGMLRLDKKKDATR